MSPWPKFKYLSIISSRAAGLFGLAGQSSYRAADFLKVSYGVSGPVIHDMIKWRSDAQSPDGIRHEKYYRLRFSHATLLWYFPVGDRA